MVAFRSLLPVAVLAVAVLGAPTDSKSSDASTYDSKSSDSSYDSKSSDSSYNSDSSDSSKDDSKSSEDSGYVSSGGSGYGDSSEESSSSAYEGSSSSAYEGSSSSVYEQSSSTASEEATSTVSSAYETATYGSGSSNWNAYEDCVQQCVAKFGNPSSSDSGSTATKTSDSGNTDNGVLGTPGTNGATHTVIVAPSQGVLRFVPFAVNASVGDTVKFEWHANNHTVTKGSSLELCNKSADADTFASGLHTKGFTYFQVVNDTKPTYYYCAAPTHCQKGMFGIINPPSTQNPSLSMGGNMQDITMSDSRAMAGKAYTEGLNSTNDAAKTWGASLSLEGVKPEHKALYAENAYFTRALIAKNPDLIDANGKLSVTSTGNPISWPADVAAAVGNAAAPAGDNGYGSSGPASSSSPAAAGTSSSAASAASGSQSAKPNGARGLAASGAFVAFVAVAASVLAL